MALSNTELYHHGILGMHWGIRKTSEQSGHSGKSTESSSADNGAAKKSVEAMSDDELKAAINRLEMERQYKELLKPEQKEKLDKGQKFVYDVFKESGKNITSQIESKAKDYIKRQLKEMSEESKEGNSK